MLPFLAIAGHCGDIREARRHVLCPPVFDTVESRSVGAVLLDEVAATRALAPLGDEKRVRIGMLYIDLPSVRTRRDKVHPTPPHRPNDNAPPSVVELGDHTLRSCSHAALRLTCHGFVQKGWFAAIRAL